MDRDGRFHAAHAGERIVLKSDAFEIMQFRVSQSSGPPAYSGGIAPGAEDGGSDWR